MTDERHFERYLEVMRRSGTPDEWERVRQEIGSPQKIIDHHLAVLRLIKAAEKREDRWRFFLWVSASFVAVISALGAIKQLLPPGVLPW